MSTAPLGRALTTQQAGDLENLGQTKSRLLSRGWPNMRMKAGMMPSSHMNESVFLLTANKMYRPPSEPSHQEEFEQIVINFIFDQEERITQLEDYMQVIAEEFMEFSLEVTRRLKERC
ncbi:hypothetical protein Tco_0475119 [Tanacetum coccineum]